MTTSQITRPLLRYQGQARHWPEGVVANLRFRVDVITGCHIWTGALNESGYGIIGTARYGNFRAHRVAYEQAFGHLSDGIQLDHKCRIRACINPEHLEPVSNAENTRRGAKAKLSFAMVTEIKRLRAQDGLSYRQLAKVFGVSSCAISNILNNKRWREDDE